MATYQTVGDDTLWRDVLAGLVDEGYAFDPLTTTPSAYLATVLTTKAGSAKSNLWLPIDQLLAQLLVTYGITSASHLTLSEAQLLGGLYDAISTGSPPVGNGIPVGLLLLLMKDP